MSFFPRTKLVFCVLVACLAAGALLAQVPPVVPNGSTVPNWAVPPYHQTSAEGGLTTMTDISNGTTFVAMTPCRVFDTRNPVGPFGGPRLIANVTRNFTIPSGPCAGIPSAAAYSMSFGAILADGNGFITIWPAGSAQPTVSSINTLAGAVIANSAIVPAGGGGAISVFPNTGVDLYGDINGYFTSIQNTGNALIQVGNISGIGIGSFINSATAGRSSGVLGRQGPAIPTPANAGAGVRGEGPVIGVYGLSQGNGVAGSQVNSSGVERAFGILGWRSTMSYPPEILNSDVGALGESFGSNGSGVVGFATATSGLAFGVQGVTLSTSTNAAGVRGIDGTGTAACNGCSLSAGVRGESFGNIGVRGISANVGVQGFHIDSAGLLQTHAELGVTSTVGLSVIGDSNVSGTKSFIEPHPTDASKIIRYISLEGNESGTYFRGRAKFQNGLARIPVPEDFRIVTDPEGLTVQVTPIGSMATVAVMKMNLQEIIVQSSRDVEFSYMVNGIRHAYKDAGPIAENDGFFTPMSRDAPMMGSFPPVIRQRLISNGTYNADGTVNMETARRLGWDKVWEERSPTAPQPVQP